MNSHYPQSPLTPDQELLVKGTSRAKCFTCGSGKLRPLIVLQKEGFPNGDPRHHITYHHEAIFGCDDCRAGYAEIRDHDCFQYDEIWDMDSVSPLDSEDISHFTECLPKCPEPISEKCECPVHKSLGASWNGLQKHLIERYSGAFPPVFKADQERMAIPSIKVEADGDLPKLILRDGACQWHGADGKIKAEGSFTNGRQTGRWTYYYDDGTKKAEGEYRDDLREGKWTEWNDRGEVAAQLIYRNGKPTQS